MLAREVRIFISKQAANDVKVEPVLKLTGADGRQASLADWNDGKEFLEWDSPWRVSNKDMWELRFNGYTTVELWTTSPLVKRLASIPL